MLSSLFVFLSEMKAALFKNRLPIRNNIMFYVFALQGKLLKSTILQQQQKSLNGNCLPSVLRYFPEPRHKVDTTSKLNYIPDPKVMPTLFSRQLNYFTDPQLRVHTISKIYELLCDTQLKFYIISHYFPDLSLVINWSFSLLPWKLNYFPDQQLKVHTISQILNHFPDPWLNGLHYFLREGYN